MRDPITRAVDRKHRHRRRGEGAGATLRDKGPDVSIALFTRIVNGVNLLRIQPGVSGEGRNLAASAGMDVESPTVIRAFDLLPVNCPVGERHTAMRTAVTHGKGAALLVAPDYQGNS